MLTEPQVSTRLEALCLGCAHEYPGAILPFLYSDELGYRCPGCGSILVVGHDGDEYGKAQDPFYLMLSERLEDSALHEKFAELVGSGEELELRVDRTDETQTVRLMTATPAMEAGTLTIEERLSTTGYIRPGE